MEPYLVDRDVLDIGAGTGSFHARAVAVARSVVGIDLDAQKVEKARAAGFQVSFGNAEAFDLQQKFDVVWAGEVIEHLSCAGAFLDCAGNHLNPGGLLLLTTPNAFAVSNFVYRMGKNLRFHDEHTAWYDEATLAHLVGRYGFTVEEMTYLKHRTPGRVPSLAAKAVRAPLPDRLAHNTLFAVCRA